MSILSALERIESKSDVVTGGVTAEMIFEVFEANQDIELKLSALENLQMILNKGDDAVERLEGIRDAILANGICKSMMYAADPKGELTAAGIVPAYEGLEDAPVKDENADKVVADIEGVIAAAWTDLKETVKSISNRFLDFVTAAVRGFKSHRILLKARQAELKGAAAKSSGDPKDEMKLLSMNDFNTVGKIISELLTKTIAFNPKKVVEAYKEEIRSGSDGWKAIAERFDKLHNETIDKLIGIVPTKAADAVGISVHERQITIKTGKILPTDGTLAALKWDKNSCIAAIDKVLTLLDVADKLAEGVHPVLGSVEDLFDILIRFGKDVATLSPKQVLIRRNLRAKCLLMVNNYNRLAQAEIRWVNKLAAELVQVSAHFTSKSTK